MTIIGMLSLDSAIESPLLSEGSTALGERVHEYGFNRKQSSHTM